MDIIETDAFFQEHPLKERYFSAGESERAGVLAVAERDVRAAVAGCVISGDEDNGFLRAAIAEQMIFLMLNPEYLTGCYTSLSSLASGGENRKFSSTVSPLGQRAAALIAPILAKSTSGETENSGAESNAGKDENFSGILKLTRA